MEAGRPEQRRGLGRQEREKGRKIKLQARGRKKGRERGRQVSLPYFFTTSPSQHSNQRHSFNMISIP